MINRLIREEVDPTAASAWLPANRPTTTMSAALNKSWRIPESIRGTANSRIFPKSGPLHISISYDLFFMILLLLLIRISIACPAPISVSPVSYTHLIYVCYYVHFFLHSVSLLINFLISFMLCYPVSLFILIPLSRHDTKTIVFDTLSITFGNFLIRYFCECSSNSILI